LKALIERALGAELGHHLGYPAGSGRPEDATNHRNGKSGKTEGRIFYSRNRYAGFVENYLSECMRTIFISRITCSQVFPTGICLRLPKYFERMKILKSGMTSGVVSFRAVRNLGESVF
jgi:hypothetical protein